MTLVNQVLQEITTVMDDVDEKQLQAVEKIISKEKRIFVLGAGRSGLMAKGFAMRLMHIGYT
ncbi:SIS domain-containing protein, partial [Oenococcus oeni]